LQTKNIQQAPSTFSTLPFALRSSKEKKEGPIVYLAPKACREPRNLQCQLLTGMVKKVAQQGRSDFGARSVRSVREHGKMARTQLLAFFSIPKKVIFQRH
jgi:hypothetical protein